MTEKTNITSDNNNNNNKSVSQPFVAVSEKNVRLVLIKGKIRMEVRKIDCLNLTVETSTLVRDSNKV